MYVHLHYTVPTNTHIQYVYLWGGYPMNTQTAHTHTEQHTIRHSVALNSTQFFTLSCSHLHMKLIQTQSVSSSASLMSRSHFHIDKCSHILYIEFTLCTHTTTETVCHFPLYASPSVQVGEKYYRYCCYLSFKSHTQVHTDAQCDYWHALNGGGKHNSHCYTYVHTHHQYTYTQTNTSIIVELICGLASCRDGEWSIWIEMCWGSYFSYNCLLHICKLSQTHRHILTDALNVRM